MVGLLDVSQHKLEEGFSHILMDTIQQELNKKNGNRKAKMNRELIVTMTLQAAPLYVLGSSILIAGSQGILPLKIQNPVI